VRRDVLRYAEPLVSRGDADPAKRYWVLATLWEAALGLGDLPAQARWEAHLQALPVPQWMHDTRLEQGNKLRSLQEQFAKLAAQGN
jgi:hypothetical protein